MVFNFSTTSCNTTAAQMDDYVCVNHGRCFFAWIPYYQNLYQKHGIRFNNAAIDKKYMDALAAAEKKNLTSLEGREGCISCKDCANFCETHDDCAAFLCHHYLMEYGTFLELITGKIIGTYFFGFGISRLQAVPECGFYTDTLLQVAQCDIAGANIYPTSNIVSYNEDKFWVFDPETMKNLSENSVMCYKKEKYTLELPQYVPYNTVEERQECILTEAREDCEFIERNPISLYADVFATLIFVISIIMFFVKCCGCATNAKTKNDHVSTAQPNKRNNKQEIVFAF